MNCCFTTLLYLSRLFISLPQNLAVLDGENLSFFEIFKVVYLTAGDKDLPGHDLIQHEVLPAGIQLRQHIVQ